MMKSIHFVIAILGSVLIAGSATAASIHAEVVGGNFSRVVIEGIIQEGDCDRLVQILKENQSRVGIANIFVTGGDFDEAMKMGRVVRALELSSSAPQLGADGKAVQGTDSLDAKPQVRSNLACNGAGFYLHVGGVFRSGTYLVVHRPALLPNQIKTLGPDLAKSGFDGLQRRSKDYLTEMGVANVIIDLIHETPPNQPRRLEEELIRKHLWGDLPYRADWLAAQCDPMTVEQKTRFRQLTNMFLASFDKNSPGARPLTAAEDKEFARLSEISRTELERRVAVITEGRAAAYKKYFGLAPSDVEGHQFERWVKAARYLGKRFDILEAEERFVTETSPLGRNQQMHFLNRSATATAPSLMLRDSTLRPFIVEGASVLSSSNPSEQFRAELLRHLGAEWGAPSGDGKSTWKWVQPGFTAELKLEPKSANGSYLALSIERLIE